MQIVFVGNRKCRPARLYDRGESNKKIAELKDRSVECGDVLPIEHTKDKESPDNFLFFFSLIQELRSLGDKPACMRSKNSG